MIPDNQISADFKLGFFASLFLTLMLFGLMNAGYAPVDDCAHTVIDSLSPYKKSVLTNQAIPVSYMKVVDWCNENLENEKWRDELKKVREQEERNDYSIPEDYTY